MRKFFNKLKKPCCLADVWSTFPIFGAKKMFPENSGLSCTTSYRFLAPCQNLEKTNDKFQENAQTDRRTDVSVLANPTGKDGVRGWSM